MRTLFRELRLVSAIATVVIVLMTGAAVLLYKHGLEFSTGNPANPGRGLHFNIQIGAQDPKVFALVAACTGAIFLVLAVWLVTREFHDRDRARAALAESEEKYRAIFEQSPAPMWVYDPETLAFLAVNDAAVAHYGHSRNEFFRMTLKDIRPEEEVPKLLEAVKFIGRDQSPFRHKKKDGTVISVEITERAITLHGRRVGLVVANDVSRRIELEQQLQQAQKIEAVGQLAGGVAHDFNNILMVMLSYCELLQEKERSDPAQTYLNNIRQAAVRGAEITRQLLAFSRQQVLQPKVIDFNQVLGENLDILRRLLGEHIRLIFSPGEKLAAIVADPVQLGQVLINLAVNARDAMPDGGDLTIESANVELDEQYCMSHHPVQPGRYVMLAVRDMGMGMDAATQRRIFEPFFTTKEAGKGTGLGLATVYGIVKQSGGYIWVYSEPGQGTIFKIYFPQVEAPLADRSAAAMEKKPASASSTVLLVEDEQVLLDAEASYLRALGYNVLCATSGSEAMDAGHDATPRVDVLVTDVVLPGASGRQVAEAVTRAHPNVRVIFMSGYAADTSLLKQISAAEAFLQKPFTLTALALKIEEVLQARQGRSLPARRAPRTDPPRAE